MNRLTESGDESQQSIQEALLRCDGLGGWKPPPRLKMDDLSGAKGFVGGGDDFHGVDGIVHVVG